MAISPTWQAATSGQRPMAGHANQFLSSHTSTILYAGVSRASVLTSGASPTATNGLWLAQSFATAAGQTTIGYVNAPIRTLTTNAANLAPTTLSLYANSGGAPTGAPLVTSTFTVEYLTVGTLNVFTTYILPITGLSPSTTYWLVTPAAGNSSDHYNWYRSTSTSTASTSTNGTAWTAQTYGFRYQIFDQTAEGPLVGTWEDSGARWTVFTNNTAGMPITYCEYTAGQTTPGYLQSVRALSYANTFFLTGVA